MTADGAKPRAVITTTPKPLKLLKDWMGRTDGSVHVTRGSTFDNAINLSSEALTELKHRYEGTRMGRQELYGELLLDVEGALWTWAMIEDFRVHTLPNDDDVVRRIVAVDPAVTSSETSSETGIITASITRNGHLYIENDVSLKASPDGWARRVVQEYERSNADAVVVETNQGGDMHRTILQTILPNLPVRKVQASSGKHVRAEPVAALYEQGKVHHVNVLPDLEVQLTEWQPTDSVSPDRLDALVWAVTELAFKSGVREVQSFRT
jgi:predicted phage terminase large subunit-like protein